jgi:biopolymer transport protein ExbD
MRIYAKGRRGSDDDPELNMIPIMNIFLVIIPFLLTSVSFFHIKAISTSVPVLADSSNSTDRQPAVKLTVIVEMQPAELRLSAISEELSSEVLKEFDHRLTLKAAGIYPLKGLNEYLQSLKNLYPASDTLILIPDNTVIYESIIQAMDAARNVNESPLFPNVVLSGSLG